MGHRNDNAQKHSAVQKQVAASQRQSDLKNNKLEAGSWKSNKIRYRGLELSNLQCALIIGGVFAFAIATNRVVGEKQKNTQNTPERIIPKARKSPLIAQERYEKVIRDAIHPSTSKKHKKKLLEAFNAVPDNKKSVVVACALSKEGNLDLYAEKQDTTSTIKFGIKNSEVFGGNDNIAGFSRPHIINLELDDADAQESGIASGTYAYGRSVNINEETVELGDRIDIASAGYHEALHCATDTATHPSIVHFNLPSNCAAKPGGCQKDIDDKLALNFRSQEETLTYKNSFKTFCTKFKAIQAKNDPEDLFNLGLIYARNYPQSHAGLARILPEDKEYMRALNARISSKSEQDCRNNRVLRTDIAQVGEIVLQLVEGQLEDIDRSPESRSTTEIDAHLDTMFPEIVGFIDPSMPARLDDMRGTVTEMAVDTFDPSTQETYYSVFQPAGQLTDSKTSSGTSKNQR